MQSFQKEFIDFLQSLQFRNTTDLLPENKVIYKNIITEPLTLLYHSLVPMALWVSDTLVTKPSKCISSMYTDMRFSRNTPLKEYMYIRFREPSGEKDILGLYFDMGSEYYSYGIRIYHQTSAGMEKIRNAALAKNQVFTREIEKLNQLGMIIIGDKFAKDHYPGINNNALKELLNRKYFYIGRNCPINESVFNGQLQYEIANAYIKLKDFYILLKESYA